jgi:DNA-binding SARP family transcriptional activator
MGATSMKFQLLGDFRILVDGQDVTPSAQKIVQILALLAMRNNEVVPTQALIDELWGERSPARAARTIHNYIYEARRSPKLHDVNLPLVTRANGYMIRAQRTEIDLNLFDELVSEGRRNLSAGYPREAREILSRALTMWHGTALANVSCGKFLAPRAVRLEEDRLRTLEMRIEVDFQLDLHHELIGELKSLTADHPFHEGLHEKLMLALCYSGRRNEALNVYQALRGRLVEDMGIEPNSRLRRTQQAVLSGDLALHSGGSYLAGGEGRAPACSGVVG